MFSTHPCKAEEDKDAPELTVKASRAIDKGLQYLLENQREDGSWGGNDEGARSTAITSLVLMAFMSRAEFPGSGPNGEALTRAKDWLLKQAAASPNGYLGSTMYEHGIATLSLSELWGMTGNKEDDAVIEKALKDAVDVIVRSQSPAGGWRYQPTPSAGEDTSVTGTVFVGLASARQAGIPIPNETIEKTLLYLQSLSYFNNTIHLSVGGSHHELDSRFWWFSRVLKPQLATSNYYSVKLTSLTTYYSFHHGLSTRYDPS